LRAALASVGYDVSAAQAHSPAQRVGDDARWQFGPAALVGWLRADRQRTVLVAVCVIHAVSPLVLVGVHYWWGWDETTYISQVSAHAPAGIWSAPRARGTSLLVMPASALTGSVPVIRLYLAALSGIGLYISFRPWQHLIPGHVIALAALLFSGLWVAIYYGDAAMPNQFVAFGAVTATGYVLLAGRRPKLTRRYAVYSGVALVITSLVRPTDATFLIAGLALLTCVELHGARRRLMLLALVAGLAVGWGEWLIEAMVSFGGISSRLHVAGTENTTGLHFALGAQMSTLAGPGLCRASCVHPSAAIVDRLWWYALVPLTALGVVAARRERNLLPSLAATVLALVLAVQYIFMISYSAPRFLLPTYALLAIPCAQGATYLVARASRHHAVALTAAVAAFAVFLALQIDVLEANIVPPGTKAADRHLDVARVLRADGVHSHCVVEGYEAAPTAYALGCGSQAVTMTGIQSDVAHDKTVAVLIVGHAPSTAYFANWHSDRVRVPGVARRLRAYIHFG
jgi:hypothetical protein